MKQRYAWTLVVILLVVAVAAVAWSDDFSGGQPVVDNPTGVLEEEDGIAEAPAAQAEIVFDFGDGNLVLAQVDVAGTVFDVTRAAAASQGLVVDTKAYPGLGILITQIGGKKNGDGGAYWQYWLNGSYATVGADQAEVGPGDRIEWKFTSSEQ